MRWGEAIRLLGDYWSYRREAVDEFSIHSPFIFELATAVLYDRTKYPVYQETEEIRKNMLQDNKTIAVEDFGAGSRNRTGTHRKVSSIARNSLKPAKYAQLLYRLARYYQPVNILEIGTSLGITTSYLAKSHENARVTTMEGAPTIAAIARGNFDRQQLGNVRIIEGKFENGLTQTLHTMQQVDLAYIDGNHKKLPTLTYFEQILPFTHNNSIIIFDDIYWSNEMKEAWAEIVNNQSVTITIDLFQMGIALFRKESKAKEHFRILL